MNSLTAELSRLGDTITNFQLKMIEQIEQTIEQSLESKEEARMDRLISEIARRLSRSAGQVVESPNSRVIPPASTDDDARVLSPRSDNQQQTEDGVAGKTRRGLATPPIPAACQQFTLQSRHRNLRSVWNEWHGLGDFQNRPIPGGIAKAEEVWKSKWRSHFEPREKKQFTRLKAVITAMMGVENQDWSDLEEAFLGPCKSSLSKMDDYLKEHGILSKKRARGRKSAIPE